MVPMAPRGRPWTEGGGIGAVRLTERCLKHDPPTAGELGELDAAIDAALAPLDLPHGVPIVGTAGTATTMAAVKLALAAYDPDAITGLRMSRAAVAEQYARLAGLTTADVAEPVDTVHAMTTLAPPIGASRGAFAPAKSDGSENA